MYSVPKYFSKARSAAITCSANLRTQPSFAWLIINTALFVALYLLLLLPSIAVADVRDGLNERHSIVGGDEVISESYDWTVALVNTGNIAASKRQFCGGSVIAEQWVLTAAHCMYDRRGDLLNTSQFKVIAGSKDLNAPDVEEIIVANFYMHPDFDNNANNPHSDIALIELATVTDVRPVAVSAKPTDQLLGLSATVTGWGATDFSNPEDLPFADELNRVDVPIVSHEVCNGPDSYENAIYDNQLCAGFAAGGADSCVGDSGGPLVATYQGEVQQVGLVSFGLGCALPNYYGIYTNIPYFIGWINQYVYVGEPEFDQDFAVPRSAPALRGGVSDGTGSASWFMMLIAGLGFLIRQRRS